MNEKAENITTTELKCYHCGEECSGDSIRIGDKYFCCNGCKTVFEILDQSNLCNYYQLEENPGISKKENYSRNFDFLDDPDLKNELIDFTDGKSTKITFTINQMHCSSCIWILENLHKLNPGIFNSEVNFLKKTLSLQYREDDVSLKNVVELLTSIGYEPELNFAAKQSDKRAQENKKLYYRIGVAGFSFGNIMLLSFPEYLGVSGAENYSIVKVFSYLNILLSLPVILFSASIYFKSAFNGLRKKILNIDVPIALGITAIFTRSIFEILSGTGPGYLDSMTALIFLLLTGRLFQNKTYESLNFERNYKSYFPIAVGIVKNGKESTIPVSKIRLRDRLLIKNNELVPADSVLISGQTEIDYSFVTGESTPVRKSTGDIIYAGGRQLGEAIEVDVVKEVSQSYLTQLWNNKIFDKKYDSKIDSITNTVSKYFTFTILAIAAGAFGYWTINDSALALPAFVSVLIIACPCALALSTPFTLGNTLRIFGRNKFYIKNTSVIERMAKISSLVFDKTGTLTLVGNSDVEYEGEELTETEQAVIKSLVRNSSHPLSRKIYEKFKSFETINLSGFEEVPGMGIRANRTGIEYQIGSGEFTEIKDEIKTGFKGLSTRVFFSVGGRIKGFFLFKNVYRKGLKDVIKKLNKRYGLSLLSGDSDGERENLLKIFPSSAKMCFEYDPFDKLKFIDELQKEGAAVMMFGDGLNDAGALQKSDVGISVSENINNFSPASDGILEGNKFNIIPDFLNFAKVSRRIIIISFIISFMYNIVGLSFAVTGTLAPVIAAVLMPISSISVVVFTTAATNFLAKKYGL